MPTTSWVDNRVKLIPEPAQRGGILYGVVERSLLPSWGSAVLEVARSACRPEQSLARGVRPPFAPLRRSQTVRLTFTAESEVTVLPRKDIGPSSSEGDGPVPVEVKLLIEFHHDPTVEDEIPCPWTERVTVSRITAELLEEILYLGAK